MPLGDRCKDLWGMSGQGWEEQGASTVDAVCHAPEAHGKDAGFAAKADGLPTGSAQVERMQGVCEVQVVTARGRVEAYAEVRFKGPVAWVRVILQESQC